MRFDAAYSEEVLETNTPMRAILEHLGATVVGSAEAGLFRVEIALAGHGDPPIPDRAHGTLYRFLQLAARGAIALRGVLKDSLGAQDRPDAELR